jgi:surface protein
MRNFNRIINGLFDNDIKDKLSNKMGSYIEYKVQHLGNIPFTHRLIPANTYIDKLNLISLITIDGEPLDSNIWYLGLSGNDIHTVRLYCSGLESITIYFISNPNIISVDFSHYNPEGISVLDTACFPRKLRHINFGDNFRNIKIQKLDSTFAGCEYIEEIDLSELDLSECRILNSVFNGCISLKKINFGDNVRTPKLEKMNCLFHCCESLKEINGLDKFYTGNVYDMGALFTCCGLEYLDLNNFIFDKCTNCNQMFQECKNLEILKIKNFKFMNKCTYIYFSDEVNQDIKIECDDKEVVEHFCDYIY